MNDRPAAVDGLDINEMKDGLVVYDPGQDRVHYLNATAAVVFTLCNGAHDRAEIADLVATAFSLEEPPRDAVEACLTQLNEEGLLH